MASKKKTMARGRRRLESASSVNTQSYTAEKPPVEVEPAWQSMYERERERSERMQRIATDFAKALRALSKVMGRNSALYSLGQRFDD